MADGQYLYRGVHAGHPAIAQAKKGMVIPGNLTGNTTPELHNEEFMLEDSPYTSWTYDIEVARDRATSKGPGGVLLRVQSGPPPNNADWRWEWSPDRYFEKEVLLQGIRIDAEVIEL